MPAIGSLSINDGEATPVAHVFAPVTTDGRVAKLANRTATSPVGYETLQLELRPPVDPKGAYRLIMGYYDPVEGTVDGNQVVLRANSGKVELNFAPNSTVQERENSLKIVANALLTATVVTMAENLEPLY